jgi:hypothetical protein
VEKHPTRPGELEHRLGSRAPPGSFPKRVIASISNLQSDSS